MYIWSMVDFWFIKIHGLLGLHFILPKSNGSMLERGEGHERKKKKKKDKLVANDKGKVASE